MGWLLGWGGREVKVGGMDRREGEREKGEENSYERTKNNPTTTTTTAFMTSLPITFCRSLDYAEVGQVRPVSFDGTCSLGQAWGRGEGVKEGKGEIEGGRGKGR